MSRSTVAILRTSPATVLADYHRLMNLAGYQDVIAKDADTALKINISWHHFYPACSTTPWQLDGVIRAMLADGYDPNRIHACHNRTVVVSAKVGEVKNKHLPVVQKHGLRNVHLYEGEEWINIHDAVGELAEKFLALNRVYPRGFSIPKRFLGENIIHLPTVKCVHPDTEVVLANGAPVKIADLVEGALQQGGVAILDEDGDTRVPARTALLSLSEEGQLSAQTTRFFWRTPLHGRNIWQIRTKTGREVKVSAEHPFLTPQGWQRAAALQPGDQIAIPRKINVVGESQSLPRLQKDYGRTSTRWITLPPKTSPDFWRWLGYFIAEGWVQPMETTCRFWWSNGDPVIRQDFVELTQSLFGLTVTQRPDAPNEHYFDSLPMQEFFEALDLGPPLDVGTKRVPPLLFLCPSDEIAAFLQGYFDGDAGVGERDGLHVVTKSERLASQVQYLLNRLGVVAFKRITWSRAAPDKPKRQYHEIAVYGDDLVTLSQHLRLRSARKQSRIEQWVARRLVGKRPSNWDTIPLSKKTFRTVRQGLGFTQSSTGRPSSVNNMEHGHTRPTRPIAQYFVERFRQADTTGAFADPIAQMDFLSREDIAWDHVESVREVEPDTEYLYDFTMESAPNFVGNGVFLHNTHVFTTTTGAMKNAFGGLLNERRHWTHEVIHETLVDLLMIQKHIHRGVFAVMDGTFAGDGPGPRCMVPYVKNVILASADQVAIDAVSAKLMGFDPLNDCKFIRLAHELELGCGDPNEIEIVGDVDAAEENWRFVGPYQKMTFASRMQHLIYWGWLKRPLEWSLKTWLAPWSYAASVVYHDWFWYPFVGRGRVKKALQSDWGRLFQNWERLEPDAEGWKVRG